MKTIRTAILDELYQHLRHVETGEEDLGIDVETGRQMAMEWVSVKRDEGRLIIKVRVPFHHQDSERETSYADRQLVLSVEKG